MSEFPGDIYKWYKKNSRNLPWRETKDPYKIWISEIILQQTRVAQGMDYYLRFIERFPTVGSLAATGEDEILKLWQGLGYYTRARNLHLAAKTIVRDYQGQFPYTYENIRKLKGVGDYTAAAVASIAFGLPYPLADGNVYRLFARYFGISTPIDTVKGKNEILNIAKQLMPSQNAGLHNQSLMEFGALQCVPKSPTCDVCPLIQSCFAAQNLLVETLPVKSKKTKQTVRYFYYYYIEHKNSVFLEKRVRQDIWKGLYQFPLFESDKNLTENEFLNRKHIPVPENIVVNIKSVSAEKKHILSHQIIFARLIHMEIDKTEGLPQTLVQVNQKDISKFAVPKLLEGFMDELHLAKN